MTNDPHFEAILSTVGYMANEMLLRSVDDVLLTIAAVNFLNKEKQKLSASKT